MPIDTINSLPSFNPVQEQASVTVKNAAESNAAREALSSIDSGDKQDALYRAGKVYSDYVRSGGTESAIDFEKGMKEKAGSLGFSQEDVDSLNSLIDNNIKQEESPSQSSSSHQYLGGDAFLAASISISR